MRPAADVALGCFFFEPLLLLLGCCDDGEVAFTVANSGTVVAARVLFLDAEVEPDFGAAFFCGDCFETVVVGLLLEGAAVLGFIWMIFLDRVGGGGRLNSSSVVDEDAAVAAARFVPTRAAMFVLVLGLRSMAPAMPGDAGETGD